MVDPAVETAVVVIVVATGADGALVVASKVVDELGKSVGPVGIESSNNIFDSLIKDSAVAVHHSSNDTDIHVVSAMEVSHHLLEARPMSRSDLKK